MNSTTLYEALRFAGFIGKPEFDGDIHQPNHMLYNELGVYIGDVLEAKGFTKTEEKSTLAKKDRTWTTFRFGNIEISHRLFSELPNATTWSFSEETANSIEA